MKLHEVETLDEVSLKTIRQFETDPRLDDIMMGWELEMIWPDHDDKRHDDDEDDFESEPDYDADEGINDLSVDAFRQDISFFFRGDHNSTRDVNRVLDSFLEDYYIHLGDKWDELYNDEDEDVRREVADRMEAGRDEETAMSEAKDDWINDNKDDMLRDYLSDEADITSMAGFMENTGNDLNWPYYTERPDDYGYSDKGELTREDLKNMFQREFRDMLTADGYQVRAIDNPSKNKDSKTWYFEPDGSLNPDDRSEGGVELTTPPMPYKRSLEYLNKVFAWAKSNGAYTSAANDTGFHMSFSLPEADMQNVDWVKLILMGGDDRVLRDFDRWAGGENGWAKSALKHIREKTAEGDLNSDMILDAIKTGLTPEARREAMKYMSTGKYTSVHPKRSSKAEDTDPYTYVEFRSAGGDALGQIEKIRTAALQYARSMVLAADPEAEKTEYAKKLYKLVSKVKADEPGLKALKDYTDGRIDKETLKFKLSRAAVARGQNPKYQPVGNMYVFAAGENKIEVVAPSLMQSIPDALAQADKQNKNPYYYNLVTEPGEKIYFVRTEKLYGQSMNDARRIGTVLIADNGAAATELASQILGVPVSELTAQDRTGVLDLSDLKRVITGNWTTKQQAAAAMLADQKAAEERAALEKAQLKSGGKRFTISYHDGRPSVYPPETHTQIAANAADAVEKFLAVNQISNSFRDRYIATPADAPTPTYTVSRPGEPRQAFRMDTPEPTAAAQPNPAAAGVGTYIITYRSPTGREERTAYDTTSMGEAQVLFRLQHPASYRIVSIELEGAQSESISESLLSEINMRRGHKKESVDETRDAAWKWLKSYLPTWPEYVLRDWIYNHFRGEWDASGDNPKTVIQRTLDVEGMTPQTRWEFVPNFHFTFDSLHPDTVRRIKERQGGAANPYGIPKDAERHATQAQLAAQQAGVRKEPVILKKVGDRYELIEGWHRTIQHFKQFPDGYKGPAWVATNARPTNEEQISESLLAEINMGAGALADFAKSDLGQSIRVGFEAEMLVPGMESDDDEDYDTDYEPNYDENTGINFNRSWRDQIHRFWRDGDFNNTSRREIDNAIEEMDEQYREYVDEVFLDQLGDGRFNDAVMNSIREDNPDLSELSDEQIRELDNYDDLADTAESDIRDRWTSDFMNNDSNFISWAEDNSLDDMMGFANRFSLDWPYMTAVSSGQRGDLSMGGIAKDFNKYSGYDSKSGSYSTRPDDKTSVFKPDSSIKRLDLPDNYAGVEFASAYMPLPQTMDMLQKFYKWAGSIGAEANASCGFHMGVSVPEHTRDTVDVLKFILFLGDEKVLADFGREASQWCQSSLRKIAKNHTEDQIRNALEEFRSGLNTEAAKMMKRRLLPSGDRYVSVNFKDDYIEIRSAGGNFLEQKDLILNTMLRYVRVLGVAASPEEAVQEYAKKLYKILSKNLRNENLDTIQYFAKYAAGTLPSTALKSFVRAVQNKRDRDRKTQAQLADPNAGKDWVTYNVLRADDNFKVHEFLAPDNLTAAQIKMDEYISRLGGDPNDYYIKKVDEVPLSQDTSTHQFLITRTDRSHAFVTTRRGSYNDVVSWLRDETRVSNSDSVVYDYLLWLADQDRPRTIVGRVTNGVFTDDASRPATQPSQTPAPGDRQRFQIVDRNGRPIPEFNNGYTINNNGVFSANNQSHALEVAQTWNSNYGLPDGYQVRPFGQNESREHRSLYHSIVEQERLAEITQNPRAFRKFLNSEVAKQVTMGFEAEMCIRGLDVNSRARPQIPADLDAEAVYPFDEAGEEHYREFWQENDANTSQAVSQALQRLQERMQTWMRNHARNQEVTPDHWRRFLRGGGHRNWTNMLELNQVLDLTWPYGSGSDRFTREQLKRDFQNSTGYQAELHGGYHTQRKPDDKFVFEFDGSIRARTGDGGQELVSYAMPLPEAMTALDKMFSWANEKGYVYTNSSTGFHVNVGMTGLDTARMDKMKLLLLLGDEKILQDFEREANSYCKSMFQKLYDQLSVRSDEQRSELLTAMKSDTWRGLRSLANRFVERAHGGEKYVSVNFKDNYIEFRSPGGDWMNHQSDIRDTVLRISQSYAAASSPTEAQQDYLKKAYKLLSGMSQGPDDSMQLFVDYNMGKITTDQFAALLAQRRGRTRTTAPAAQAAQAAPTTPAFYMVTDADNNEVARTFVRLSPLDAADWAEATALHNDEIRSDETYYVQSDSGYAIGSIRNGQFMPRPQQAAQQQTGLVRSGGLTDVSTGEYAENILLQLPRDMTIAQSWTLYDNEGDEVESFTDTAQGAVSTAQDRSDANPEYQFALEPAQGYTFATFSAGRVYFSDRVLQAARTHQAFANTVTRTTDAHQAADDEENDEIDLGDLDQWEPEQELTAPTQQPPRPLSTTPQQDRYRVFYIDADGYEGETIITAASQPDAVNQFRRQYPTVTMNGIVLTSRAPITRESIELDEVTQNPAVWDRFLTSDAAKKITMGFEAEMLVKGLVSSGREGINPDDDARIHNITTGKGQERFRKFWLQNGLNSEREVESALAYLGKNYPRIHRDLTDMSDLLAVQLISLKWPFSNPDVFTRERLAQMFTDTTGYKVNVGQSATNDAFGLVFDGSLQPRTGDGGVELVSNAMPLPEAMQALNKTFQWARDSKLIYTNRSSGFHINVGLAGTTPKDIDKLKLLLLVGDQAILKEFGRMKNEYCASMLARLKKALKWKRTGKDPNNYGGWWDTNDILNKSDEEIDAVLAALRGETWKGLRDIANQLVSNLHNEDKYVSINVHDKYIEFRSPGGNWLPKWDQIYYTVLRVTHAYALAADPVEGKQDYLKKAYKILSTGAEQNDELKNFIDFSMGKVDAAQLKGVLGRKHQQGPQKKSSYGIKFQPKGGKKSYVHVFHTDNDAAAVKYAHDWMQKNLPEYANTNRWELNLLPPDQLTKIMANIDKQQPPATSESLEETITRSGVILDNIMPDGQLQIEGHIIDRALERQISPRQIARIMLQFANRYGKEVAGRMDSHFVVKSKSTGIGMTVIKTQRPDDSILYKVTTIHPLFVGDDIPLDDFYLVEDAHPEHQNFRVYVDMDGVLADFFGEWSRLSGVDHYKDIDNVEAKLQLIREHPTFWTNLPVLPHAKELVRTVQQLFGEWYVCSKPLEGDPRSAPGKRAWIQQHFSEMPPAGILLTYNKAEFATTETGPAILIDDYGVNIAQWQMAGGIGLKYEDTPVHSNLAHVKKVLAKFAKAGSQL
jgi:5'(3')-deoxyribonucleotidase